MSHNLQATECKPDGPIRDVGLPLFECDRRKPKIEAYVPTEQDQRHLTKQEQSWMLVEIPAVPDYSKYALAALRPLRKIAWEKHAQKEVMDSTLPQDGLPNTLNQRRTGSALEHQQHHPDRCNRLRLLVRLSDALNRAALDRTQDWFFLDLPLSAELPATETVGDLLLFVADLVGNDRLRPGHLTISASRSNDCGIWISIPLCDVLLLFCFVWGCFLLGWLCLFGCRFFFSHRGMVA